MRALLVASVLVLVALGAPPRARACVYGGCGDLGFLILTAGVGGTLVGLATLGVLGQDLYYLSHDEPPPHDLAVASLVLGLVDVAGGIALALGGTDTFLGFGLAFVGAGSILAIDGVVALATARDGPSPPVRVAFSARPNELVIGLSGRF